MFHTKLRTKFLLALSLISALLTCATLMTVRHRVQLRVREQLSQELRNSVNTFQSLRTEREQTLERSAALLATLPPLMAVMTSQDPATIQDASTRFWELSGSQLFVLAGLDGQVLALHSKASGTTRTAMERSLRGSMGVKRTKDWWLVSGHLFQVFLQPIFFGAQPENPQVGYLAMGFELDTNVAQDLARVSSSQVVVLHEGELVATTVPPAQQQVLKAQAAQIPVNGGTGELDVAGEQFLVTAVRLSGDSPRVTLAVLKSFDEATQFLASLNRWILGVGVGGVLCGIVLVFLVSTTFTRPLAELVKSVQALEMGDFEYPLQAGGSTEVSTLTSAFRRMRGRLQESQKQMVANERLATIGRMATTISHDLRHPLTAILAYAEFLSETELSEHQRRDFFQEIRIAVNRMTDELNSLLGFSKQGERLHPVHARLEEVVERAMQTVRVLPEFESIRMEYSANGDCSGYFDASKIERAVVNLLFNACEAVSPESGEVQVATQAAGDYFEIRVKDNGPGIPAPILDSLFQPFASYGKEKGIGLGLTVVQKIATDHGGEARVEQTGPDGSVFLMTIPSRAAVPTF